MRVAITGGSGSLGRALINRLARQGGAEQIVTFTRDEHKRAQLQRDYAWHPGVKVYSGDITHPWSFQAHFHGMDAVIHAAARKVVTGHHDEPAQHAHTNVIGTRHVLEAAQAEGVRRVLFISSDKAVRSINCYGHTKATAEKLVISWNAQSQPRTRCAVLRYGNVLASNGSVVRRWRDLAASGRPVELTDRRMTRFWLTLGQAADYVLRVLGEMRAGGVYIPELKAAPLTRVLKAVAPRAQVCVVGIRSGGEKLHEELINEDEVCFARRRNGLVVVGTDVTSSDAWDTTPWLGDPVPDDFRYCSEDWPMQWTVSELRSLIGDPVR